MERKFYNSTQWGIQKKNLNKIRSRGLDYLEQIGCKTCVHYCLEIGEAIKEPEKLDKIFDNNVPFLVLIEPNDKKLEKIGSFNITDKKSVYKLISQIKPEEWKNYSISFIEEIQNAKNSLTGTAISDGKGKLFMEFLKGTTNSKYLTSAGADPKKIENCYFRDFEIISQIPNSIPIEIIEKIKEYCHNFKGYYEFIYGSSTGKEDIYFTFYSDIKDYRNILEKLEQFTIDEISTRIKYNYLKQRQYFGVRKPENDSEERI